MIGPEGAIEAVGLDAGIAWHYGNPTREQRLLASGDAVVDLANRGVVTVAGPDRLTWLDTLSTQWLRDLAPGSSTEALILSPHGHIENALHIVDDGETTWITVEPRAAESLVTHLERMKFMLRVEITHREDWGVLGFVPGGSVEQALTGPLSWDDPWPATAPGGARYNPTPDDEHPGRERPWRELLVPLAEMESRIDGLEPAGSWAAEALRVAALRPRFSADTDGRSIPHELDWLRTAVHLQKGCYRGQETIARVHNLGQPPRRLVLLHLDGSGHELPHPGAAVHSGAREVGRITTPVRHHEDGPIALAVVKRSVPLDAPLQVGDVAAAQEPIVAPAKREPREGPRAPRDLRRTPR